MKKQYNEPLVILFIFSPFHMQIIVDVREHALIEKFASIGATIITEQLLLGDVLLRSGNDEILLFERKSLADLLASIKDGRYEEQSHRLIHTSGMNPHNIIYVVEGVLMSLKTPADKKVVFSAMTSLSYFKGFSVFRTSTVLETAELIAAMAAKLEKEFAKGREKVREKETPASLNALQNNIVESTIGSSEIDVNSELEQNVERLPAQTESYSAFVKKAKKDNITPQNIGEIFLCQIPGISSHIAQAILKHFNGSFFTLIEEIKTQPEKLNAIFVETTKGDGKRRKLSSSVIQSILSFLKE